MKWGTIILLFFVNTITLADTIPPSPSKIEEGGRWTLRIAEEKGLLEFINVKHSGTRMGDLEGDVRWQNRPGKFKARVGKGKVFIKLRLVSARDRTRYRCDGELVPIFNHMSGNCRGDNRSSPWQATPAPPGDAEPPLVQLIYGPAPPRPGSEISITAHASDPSGIDRVEILVNQKIVQTCRTSRCTWRGGPFGPGSITYGANAYDKAGNRKWTGYKTITITQPAREGDRRYIQTMHKGKVLYRYHNYNWYRVDGIVQRGSRDWNIFFPDYFNNSRAVQRLLRDAGFNGQLARSSEEVWERVRSVWAFLDRCIGSGSPVRSATAGNWPSIVEYADRYARTKKLTWAACFSKAHLFATLLGRMIADPSRIAIASCTHLTDDGKPTATHVYLTILLGGRWLYLDPAMATSVKLPPYSQRRSIKMPTPKDLDYEHPYKILTLPKSRLSGVPFLG